MQTQSNKNVLNIDIGTNCGICINIPQESKLVTTTIRMKYNSDQTNAFFLSELIRKICDEFNVYKVNFELVCIQIGSERAFSSHWFFYGVILGALKKDTIVTTKGPMAIRTKALRGSKSKKGITTGGKLFTTWFINKRYDARLDSKLDHDSADSVLIHLANEGDVGKVSLVHYKFFKDIFEHAVNRNKKIPRQ